MSNTKLILLCFSLFMIISCKSGAQTIDKIYRFNSKESGIFDHTFVFEVDSTNLVERGERRICVLGIRQTKKNHSD